MKELLVDYIPFEVSPEQINESIKNNGKLVVKGVLQRAEAKNQNGRIYPKDILVREAKKYSEVQIKERRALGERHQGARAARGERRAPRARATGLVLEHTCVARIVH